MVVLALSKRSIGDTPPSVVHVFSQSSQVSPRSYRVQHRLKGQLWFLLASFVKSGIILENAVAPFLMRRIKQRFIAVAFATLQTMPCSHAPNANTQLLRHSHLPLLLRLLPATIRTPD